MCNFYYGNHSKRLIKNKKALPLNGNSEISFDHIEILSRDSSKLIHIKDINKLPIKLKKNIKKDLTNILKRKKNFSNFNLKKNPNVMGILNLTPDSFSDGENITEKIWVLNMRSIYIKQDQILLILEVNLLVQCQKKLI